MTQREQLEQDAADLRKKAEQLEAQIKQLPVSGERWKPGRNGLYWLVSDTGAVHDSRWNTQDLDPERYSMGNMFATRREAELHKLRLESMANRWKPENGGIYCYWQFNDGSVDTDTFDGHSCDLAEYANGNMHPTREAARAWHKKYGEAWEALLK